MLYRFLLEAQETGSRCYNERHYVTLGTNGINAMFRR